MDFTELLTEIFVQHKPDKRQKKLTQEIATQTVIETPPVKNEIKEEIKDEIKDEIEPEPKEEQKIEPEQKEPEEEPEEEAKVEREQESVTPIESTSHKMIEHLVPEPPKKKTRKNKTSYLYINKLFKTNVQELLKKINSDNKYCFLSSNDNARQEMKKSLLNKGVFNFSFEKDYKNVDPSNYQGIVFGVDFVNYNYKHLLNLLDHFHQTNKNIQYHIFSNTKTNSELLDDIFAVFKHCEKISIE